MALTFNGTTNGLSDSILPSGYTKPTVTTFADGQWTYTRVFTITKSNVENATASTTMTNIFNDATYGLDAIVEAEIANDFDTTNTVTAYATLTSLTSNLTPEDNTSNWLDNTAEAYSCTVKMFVKVA